MDKNPEQSKKPTYLQQNFNELNRASLSITDREGRILISAESVGEQNNKIVVLELIKSIEANLPKFMFKKT